MNRRRPTLLSAFLFDPQRFMRWPLNPALFGRDTARTGFTATPVDHDLTLPLS
jgi:hypothetical protein